MKGFMDFIREQGVVGLAVGFILGGAVSGLVASLVNDLINPVLGLLFDAGSLEAWTIVLSEEKGSELALGNFISLLINFIIIAAVVYFVVKGLGLDKLDKKKD